MGINSKATAILVSIGIGVSGMAGLSATSVEYKDIVNEINDLNNKYEYKIAEIRTSNEYKKYYDEDLESLYEEYKNGKMTAQDFNKKLEYLNSDAYVEDNSHVFAEDDAVYLQDNRLSLRNVEDRRMRNKYLAVASVLGTVGGLGGATLTSILTANADETKEREL